MIGAAESNPAEQRMNKKTLLIVDDSRVSRMMIRALVLERQPEWQIFEAGNGEEAINQVRENMPDYVTMDMNMPGMDGVAASEQIRQAYPTTKIVLLTANIQESSRQKAQQLGLAFVTKPITAACIDQALAFYAQP
jgi:two-component system chemotaxis response regulator CheY